MTNLGGSVHCTKISPEFEFGGQRSKARSLGTKKTPKNCWVIPIDIKACAARRT